MAQTGFAKKASCKNKSASPNTRNVTHDMSKTMNTKDQAKNKIKRIVKKQNPNAFHVHVQLCTKESSDPIPVVVQIDSGCTRSMINRSFAKASGLTILPLRNPLQVEGCNHTVLDQVDGRVQLRLRVGHHAETITLWTMNLTDDTDLLLGYDWLRRHNPHIDWKEGTCYLEKCPEPCDGLNRDAADSHLGKWDRRLSEDDKLFVMDVQGYLENKATLGKYTETVKRHHRLSWIIPTGISSNIQTFSVRRTLTSSHQGGHGIIALN